MCQRVGSPVRNTASGSMALTRFRQLCAARVPTSRRLCDQSLLWNDKAIALRLARACSRSCLSDLMPRHMRVKAHGPLFKPAFRFPKPRPQALNQANAVLAVQGKAPYFSRGVILPRRRCLNMQECSDSFECSPTTFEGYACAPSDICMSCDVTTES